MKIRDIQPFGLRLPPDLKEWIEGLAVKEERSQNWLIVNMIRDAKARHEQIKQP